MHHVAATLGMTVRELSGRMTFSELNDWMKYFDQLNSVSTPQKPNLLDNPDALVKAMTGGP